MIRIDDSIKLISQYVIMTTMLIRKICTYSEYETTPPFQLDLIIRLRKVVDVSSNLLMSNNNKEEEKDIIKEQSSKPKTQNNKDEEESSDDHDPEYPAPKEKERLPIDYGHDYVGDVANRIKTENLVNFGDTIPVVDLGANNETTIKIMAIQMQKTFNKFKRKVDEHRKDRYKNHNDKNSTEIDSKQADDEQVFSWPTRKRFCAYIDGRTNDLLFYEVCVISII